MINYTKLSGQLGCPEDKVRQIVTGIQANQTIFNLVAKQLGSRRILFLILLSIAKVESGFNWNIQNPIPKGAGAFGMFQILPSTQKLVLKGSPYTKIRTPEEQVFGALRVLQDCVNLGIKRGINPFVAKTLPDQSKLALAIGTIRFYYHNGPLLNPKPAYEKEIYNGLLTHYKAWKSIENHVDDPLSA